MQDCLKYLIEPKEHWKMRWLRWFKALDEDSGTLSLSLV